nr:hypothetical protein [Pseudomonas fluorescens]
MSREQELAAQAAQQLAELLSGEQLSASHLPRLYILLSRVGDTAREAIESIETLNS